MILAFKLKKAIWPVSLLLVIAPLFATATPEFDIQGIATNNKTNESAYVEYHRYDKNGEHSVNYVSTDGEPIAQKVLTYPLTPYQPEFTFTDLRSKLTLGSKVTQTEVTLKRKKNKKKEKNRLFKRKDNMVIDAGFVEYIKSFWEELSTEERKITFMLPNRLNTIDLTIRQLDISETPFVKEKGVDSLVFFKCQPKSRFIGFFMKPIYLAYEKESRRIKYYHGLSNINDKNDDSVEVTIKYTYANAD